MITARVKKIKDNTTKEAEGYKDSFEYSVMYSIGFLNFENKIFCGNKLKEWFVCVENRYNYHISWLKNIDGARK